MCRKIIKILNIVLVFILILSVFYSVAASTVTSNFKGSSIDGEAATKIGNVLGIALDVVRTVGVGIAILLLTIIGAKYMLASAGERADIKKNAVPFVIGAVILFASSTIVTILKNFAINATNI